MQVLPLRFRAAQRIDILNVKDFGAKGDGSTPDGAAIQAAFDSAYGASGYPNSANGLNAFNKGIFFPAGTYLVDQQLFLNQVQGAYLFGAGQGATRLLYNGPASNLPKGDVTSLLTCRSMDYSVIEGITFDVTGSNARVAVQIMNFGSLAADGTGNVWFDCGFVGGIDDGFLIGSDGSGATGSEEYFCGCTFDSCTTGAFINSGNALDYGFVGCKFLNCVRGIYCVVGSINTIKGCSFNNPSYASFTGSTSGNTLTVISGLTGTIAVGQILLGIDDIETHITGGSGSSWTIDNPSNKSSRSMTTGALDILVKQQQCPAILGCRSVSQNFCSVGPAWIAGCSHNPPNAGYLWLGGIDNPRSVIEGCSGGANSAIFGNAGQSLYLRGNTFANAGYLTNFAGTVVENI
jgi:hypothetical protein